MMSVTGEHDYGKIMVSNFPHYRFSGTPQERGGAYGETLRESIQTTYSLYTEKLFPQQSLSPAEIENRANHLRQIITDFDARYTTELDAVASGSNLPRWQIYALNGRTEIMNAPLPECTALYFQDESILGQNWDWVAALEELAVLVTWELSNGHKILSFTEPGMLSKIGFNDSGIGVCLNILFAKHQANGVPVHILTRALLDCASLDEARAMLKRGGFGKSSHLLIGDDGGNACSMEFTGSECFEVLASDQTYLHTNHCIAPAAIDRTALIPSTLERLNQAKAWLAQAASRNLETMKEILLDDTKGEVSINGCYHPEPLLDGQDVGTCATILMDLPNRQMQIKKGPGRAGEFLSIDL